MNEHDVEEIYRGRIVNLRRARVSLPGGKVTTLDLMSHPGAAAIVPACAGEYRLTGQGGVYRATVGCV